MAEQKTMIPGKGKNASAGLGGRADATGAHCGALKHMKHVWEVQCFSLLCIFAP